MQARRSFLLAILAAPLLAACTAVPPAATFPEISFTGTQPLRLAVGSLEVINEFRLPFKAPHVEHKMPAAPGPAAERWGRDVLKPTGGADRLVLIITDASVVETALQRKAGIEGAFTNEQAERYDARIAARLEIRADGNRIKAKASAFATRSASIAENASLAEREALWYELTETLLQDFDRAIRPQVNRHFQAWLR